MGALLPPAAASPPVAETAGPSLDSVQARQAAEEFEALFLSQMLAPVFEKLGNDPLVGGGPGEQVYRSLMVREYGKAIARSGGVSIAEAVQREILRLQEIQS